MSPTLYPNLQSCICYLGMSPQILTLLKEFSLTNHLVVGLYLLINKLQQTLGRITSYISFRFLGQSHGYQHCNTVSLSL